MESNEIMSGISRAAVLVYLSISTYSGRKQDKRTQSEVTVSKGAKSKRAASVYKALFADCKELEAVTKFAAQVRNDHMHLTLPWSDGGQRLLPAQKLLDYQQRMTVAEQEFRVLVDRFLDKYDTLVAAAAFQLGDLFDRSEYPLRAEVATKFSIDVAYSPVPIAGDFRLDIETEVQQDMQTRYAQQAQQQVEAAQRDAWTRLYTTLSRISERLADEETPRVLKNGTEVTTKIFRDSLVDNASELCDLLTAFNVTGDQALERARARLNDALVGVTPADLRGSDSTRHDVKQQVDAILSDFDWSFVNDDTQTDDAAEEAPGA